jgi:hypothetical protein
MNLTEKNLLKILDILVTHPNWATAMKSIGMGERAAYEWRAKSAAAQRANDTSSPFYIQWREIFDFWHCHCGRARTENKISYEAKVRDQAANGIEEPVFGPDQKPVWKENERYLHRSDDYIRLSEGLDDDADVAWYRIEHDEQGRPVQLTRRTQIPAPLRKAVLAAAHPDYRESLDVNIEHSGTVHVAKPLERLKSEPRAGADELRRLAAMSPEQRREAIGASPFPKDARGLRTIPQLAPPNRDDMPDHVREQKPPKPRPAYAKPVKPLDSSGTGLGEIPPGGMKMI